jgi:hypothetical protein
MIEKQINVMALARRGQADAMDHESPIPNGW